MAATATAINSHAPIGMRASANILVSFVLWFGLVCRGCVTRPGDGWRGSCLGRGVRRLAFLALLDKRGVVGSPWVVLRSRRVATWRSGTRFYLSAPGFALPGVRLTGGRLLKLTLVKVVGGYLRFRARDSYKVSGLRFVGFIGFPLSPSCGVLNLL